MRFKLRFSTRAAAEMEAVLEYTLMHFRRAKFLEYADVFSLHIGRRGRRARHLFLYRVSEDSGSVDILRLLHDSMELRIQEWDEI